MQIRGAGVVLRAMVALIVVGSAFGSTYDLVAQFNTTVNANASSVFSYGVGTAGSGSFTTDAFTFTNNDCFGVASACIMNNTSFPLSDTKTWNNTGVTQHACCSNVQITTDNLTMDPQSSAGDIVRFTAPVSGVYSVSGNYSAQDWFHHTTIAYVYTDNSVLLFQHSVDGYGDVETFSLPGISLTAGQSIDFVLYGNGDSSYLTTGLQGIITGPDLPSSGAPEPGTLAMLLLAAPAVWMRRRR